MKVYDAAFVHGIYAYGGRKVTNKDEFYQTLASAQVVDIQNAAEMFYADHEKVWHPMDFPNIAPPFAAFWMEFKYRRSYAAAPDNNSKMYPFGIATLNLGFDVEGNMQEYLDGKPEYPALIQAYFRDLMAGKRRQAMNNGELEWSPIPKADPSERLRQMWNWLTIRDPLPFEKQYAPDEFDVEQGLALMLMRTAALKDFVDVRWILIIHGFIESIEGPIMGPVLSCVIPVTPDGKLWDGISFIAPERTETTREKVIDQSYHIMNPTLFAISLMHCKNVNMATEVPQEKIARAYRRRHGRSLTSFHVLNIEPMRKVLRTEGRSETTGLKRAMHICRGHFKTFDEKPLFGKHRGMYWWDQQLRGNKDQGRVEKVYSIHPERGAA